MDAEFSTESAEEDVDVLNGPPPWRRRNWRKRRLLHLDGYKPIEKAAEEGRCPPRDGEAAVLADGGERDRQPLNSNLALAPAWVPNLWRNKPPGRGFAGIDHCSGKMFTIPHAELLECHRFAQQIIKGLTPTDMPESYVLLIRLISEAGTTVRPPPMPLLSAPAAKQVCDSQLAVKTRNSARAQENRSNYFERWSRGEVTPERPQGPHRQTNAKSTGSSVNPENERKSYTSPKKYEGKRKEQLLICDVNDQQANLNTNFQSTASAAECSTTTSTSSQNLQESMERLTLLDELPFAARASHTI